MPPTHSTTALPRGAIACLSLAAFGSGVSLRVNDALLPRLALEFGISIGQAAQVTSLFAIAYGVATLLFGPLGDRFGKYRVIAWACVACALAAGLCARASGFDQLRIGRLFAGATAAAIIPLSMAWIGDVVDYEQRQPVLARFLIGQILGVAAGVSLGGFAADHLDWRQPYLFLAGFFTVIALALLRMQPRLPELARAARALSTERHHMLLEFREVLALPWARVVLLSVFLEGTCLYGPFAFIASHLHGHFGMSLSSAGAVVMLFGAGGFVFALGSARLARRLGERGLVRVGGALVCASLVGLALAPQWGWAPPACLLTGLGFYMLHNTLQLNATQMAPERRGAAVAAFASCFFMGQSAGVALGGQLIGSLGTAGFIAAGGVGVLVVATGFAAKLARRYG